MSKIVDLGVLVKEPLIFKNCPDGKEYVIPGDVSTKFVMKLFHYQEEMQKFKSEEEFLRKTKEIVADILSLDKEKDVDVAYIDKYFDSIPLLTAIIKNTISYVTTIQNDPNSNSPQSQQ